MFQIEIQIIRHASCVILRTAQKNVVGVPNNGARIHVLLHFFHAVPDNVTTR